MAKGEMGTDNGTKDRRQKEKSRALYILLVASVHFHCLLNIISIFNC